MGIAVGLAEHPTAVQSMSPKQAEQLCDQGERSPPVLDQQSRPPEGCQGTQPARRA